MVLLPIVNGSQVMTTLKGAGAGFPRSPQAGMAGCRPSRCESPAAGGAAVTECGVPGVMPGAVWALGLTTLVVLLALGGAGLLLARSNRENEPAASERWETPP